MTDRDVEVLRIKANKFSLVSFAFCFQIKCFCYIFTVRNSSCGKVMFLHLSVSHSVHGEGRAWRRGMHGKGVCGGGGMRGRRDGHCSGRYASYWNAFFL